MESFYKKREAVMNVSEQDFFKALCNFLPDGYYIFPKMRIADFIEVTDGNGYYKNRNSVLPKHVDFLICDSSYKPVLAFELNGSSHDNDKAADNDNFKYELLESVGIALRFIQVGSDYTSEIEAVIELSHEQ